MFKKFFSVVLVGTAILFHSCIDDTYDLRKQIATDLKIEGNKLSIPLGSLTPIVLDSILDMASVPVLTIDSVTRSYSLSLNDTVGNSVPKESLEALKEISKLSASIDPVPVNLGEIKFSLPSFKQKDTISFEDVVLGDVTFNPIHEEVDLPIGKIELDTITIEGTKHTATFDIPKVSVDDINIGGYNQSVSFSIPEVKVEKVSTEPIEQKLSMSVNEIDMDVYTLPSLTTEKATMLQNSDINDILNMFGDDYKLPISQSFIFKDEKTELESEVNIEFQYTLPNEIKSLNVVELAHNEDLTKPALVQFEVVNPTLLKELDRTIDFEIAFPENYVLALEKTDCYKLIGRNKITVTDMPANGEKTIISFYLQEITGLGDKKFYKEGQDGRNTVQLADKVKCNIIYSVSGTVNIDSDTSVKEIKEGLTFSIGLDAKFGLKEVHGSTNTISSDFNPEPLDFSFTINDLNYIEYIDKVELDHTESVLKFTTKINNNFGDFDIDYPNSKIVLSLPEAYIFNEDNMTLPQGVKFIKENNLFEISSLSAFNGDSNWELPVSTVEIKSNVNKGTLDFQAQAHIKAITNGKEGSLTMKAMDNIALKNTVDFLCQPREINFYSEGAKLLVTDVKGKTSPIELELEEKTFTLNFDIENLDHIQYIESVELNTSKKITLTSSTEKGFGDIQLKKGSYIALCFPEEYVFDTKNSTLPHNSDLNAFLIDDLSKLANGKWSLALQCLNVNKEVDKDNKLSLSSTITMKAINADGIKDSLYVVSGEEFSLDAMKNVFGKHNIQFNLENSVVSVKEVKGISKDIDIEFKGAEVDYEFLLDKLEHINHIGKVELEEGHNYFTFRSNLSKSLGKFNLAANSAIEFIFPEIFVFDKENSSVPKGIEFDGTNKIKITDLTALNSDKDWKLAIDYLNINQSINEDKKFEGKYKIRVVGRNTEGKEEWLTIAALNPFLLSEVTEGGETNTITMTLSMLDSDIIIDDVVASIDKIDFEFETQRFPLPVDIENLDMVKEIKHLTFEENEIELNIQIDGGSLKPFDLSENSQIKISLPKEFILGDKSDFAGLTYRDNAIYINDIASLENCNMKLILDRIEINQEIENNQFNWEGEITVSAINNGKEGTLYIVCDKENLKLSEVENAMGDKTIIFDIPSVQLKIKEAVMVSNVVKSEICDTINIPIDEPLAEPIDRIDSIGFMSPVPMTMKITAGGLESVTAPVNLEFDINLPPIFALSSDDEKVTITQNGIHVATNHKFSESNTIELKLWINRLDFTKIGDGYLALPKTADGGRRLIYNSEAIIKGLASMDNAELSSEILNNDLTLDIDFQMGEIVLKNFTGIYGGSIDPVSENFQLGIEDGFAGFEENGISLSNTKPELKILLYNSIGVPVDVDLSIIGRDKQGNAISSSTIEASNLRIKPAYHNKQGVLTTDTTRWLFTSNKNAEIDGYETIVIENLDSLLNELPHSIDFNLVPQIVTKDVLHYVDISQPLELGGSYSISVEFDIQFARSFPLDFGEEADAILRNKKNKLTLANPQIALSIHNPIAEDLVLDLSIVGKNANGETIESASLIFDEPFVLEAGELNEDSTITPKTTSWLFAVNDSITKQGYETKVAPALGTLLNELPHNMDIALNAHFNTDITTKIDYENDLNLVCEYGILVPLQFNDLQLNYTDTISEIKINLEETLAEMNLSINNVGVAIGMNLKNTLPLGIKLNLIPLDINGNIIEGIEIGSIELPAGNGSDIGNGSEVEGKTVELSIKCASSTDLSALDKVAFELDVTSGNEDEALCGSQGLQICDIVLQIMCDIEFDLSK